MPRLSSAQRDVVETLSSQLFVAAGAGAGKTFTLVQRLVGALEPDPETGQPFLDSLDRALVITFTNKAADELKGRVRQELMGRGRHEEALLLDTAWISTIHGMCERILRSCALELGIDPSFSVVEGHRASYLQARAVSDVLAEARGDQRYRVLFERYGAGTDAVAMSGVAERPRGRGFRPPATAPEMAREVFQAASASLLGFGGVEFHGEAADPRLLAERVAASYRALLDLWEATTPAARRKRGAAEELRSSLCELASRPALEPGDLLVLLEGSGEGLTLSKAGIRDAAVKEAIDDAKAAVAVARAQLAYDQQVRPLEPTLLNLARAIGERYDQLKREEGVLDNDDLLRLTFDALRDNPGVGERFRGRFKLVMVDEFQDTDPKQFEIVRLLAASPDALCFVGDAQQSIYRFRGADVEQYERARAEAPHVLALDRNYRSHGDILRFVNHALGASGILKGFMDLEPDAGRADGFAAVDAPRVSVEHTVGDASVGALRARNAEQVAERLQELHKQGVPAGDMALLVRTKSEAELYIRELRAHDLDAVMTAGSSFAQASEVRLVHALLVALANPYDTRNGLIPVLQGPIFGLTDDELATLARADVRRQSACGLAEAVLAGPERLEERLGTAVTPRLAKAAEVLAQARVRMGAQPVADTVLSVCVESGWIARLEKEGPAGRAQAANVLACVRRIREVVDEPGLGFSHAPKVFGDWLSGTQEPPAAVNAEGAEAVSVMTIHSAKGLEFPVVAVAGAFDDSSRAAGKRLVLSPSPSGRDLSLKPERFSEDDTENKAFSSLVKAARGASRRGRPVTGLDWRFALEDREAEAEAQETARLLYVALTRAREALVLGIVTKEQKEGVSPVFAGRFLDAVCGAVPVQEGSEPFDYGGERLGELRTTRLDKAEADTADAEEPASEALEPKPFPLYDQPRLAPPIRPWRTTWDVRSYSADRHQADVEAAREALGEERDIIAEDEGAWALSLDELQEGPALAFGDAFHELACEMAGQRRPVPPERVAAAVRYRGLSDVFARRLADALAAWWNSDLRKEAWSYPSLTGEAPFFQRVRDEQGGYLTGSIDLLAADGARALVVDYKTGEQRFDVERAREEHEMQARYYAHVLIEQGFHEVQCAFVLVENLTEGQPLTVRFSFEGPVSPELGAPGTIIKEAE